MSRAWFKFYGRDFRDGVRDLPWDVIGIYTALLTLMYEEEGARIADHDQRLCRLIGCDIRMWRRAKTTLIGAGKLHARDGFLTNDRAEIEAKSAEHLGEVRAISGRSSRQLSVSNAPKPRKTKEPPQANASDLPLYARASPEAEAESDTASLRSASRAPRRRTGIGLDLSMPESAISFAATNGFVNGNADALWERFKNHHASKGTMFASIDAGWRTWVLNEIKFSGDRHGYGSGNGGNTNRAGARNGPRSAATIIMERALSDEPDDGRPRPPEIG